jgi:hypothetical protein
MDFLIQIGIAAALLLIGLCAGMVAERRHLKRLAEEEATFVAPLMITDLRSFPMCGTAHTSEADAPALVSGEAVISSDYFKTFVAALKKIIGGELRTLETLMSRARREAVVRMGASGALAGV